MTPNRRLTIIAVVLIGYSVTLLAVLALGVLASLSMQNLEAAHRDLYRHPFAVSNAAADIKICLMTVRSRMLEAFFVEASDLGVRDVAIEFNQEDARIRADLDVIRAYYLGDMNDVRSIEQGLSAWNSIRSEAISAWMRGQTKDAQQLIKSDSTATFEVLMASVDEVLKFAQRKARIFRAEAKDSARASITRVLLLVGAGIVLILATAGLVLWRVRYLQQELDRRATTDFLTGVPNRRHFMELAHREFERAKRYQGQFVLAVVDLDLFKQVNDKYGHPTGDAVLRAFCELCQREKRASDVLGRIGGEEFGILLPNTGLSEAQEILERIRLQLESTSVPTPQGLGLAITASFGLAAFAIHHRDLGVTLGLADKALYTAKQAGRNRVCRARSEHRVILAQHESNQSLLEPAAN